MQRQLEMPLPAPELPVALIADFKIAMRRLASTVAIITTHHADTWYGMAATAVTSVSSDPPCLLIAVNRTASLHSPVSAAGKFCVNLLGAQHDDLIGVFSGALKGPERFHHGTWRQGHDGMPYLQGSAASVFCDLDAQVDHGTHTLFIGAVRNVVTDALHDPMVWVNGRSARVVEGMVAQ
jgi:flavin reductase (DIM6/NTAB) family NADH-FMN oxidoreductase RutF